MAGRKNAGRKNRGADAGAQTPAAGVSAPAAGVQTPAARFFRSARLCRARDLTQLSILGDLVQGISKLIHALQKERGATSIFLGSGGATFVDRLAVRVAESRDIEALVRERLEHIDEQLDRISVGARFYTRVALAFLALDTLPDTRQRIAALLLTPQDAVKAFSDVIGRLLAVGFETADIAADPSTSRALVALVNFSQGKEYAGQERATAGAAFSRGRFDAAEQRRLQYLASAQDQALRIFAEFADPAQAAAVDELRVTADSLEVQRVRRLALEPLASGAEPLGVTADHWYEVTTRRIDAMKLIEDRLAADLVTLCAAKLAEAQAPASSLTDPMHVDGIRATAAVAMLITDADPALNSLGLDAGIGFYGVDRALDGALPTPMRSILDVVEAQSRRIDDVSSQLESARTALAERKTIERAKGILMKNRRLTETDAYALLRQTAMSQNRRLVEIAEAVLNMADMLKV
jgi:AmiR/NasT family two-component response regulator